MHATLTPIDAEAGAPIALRFRVDPRGFAVAELGHADNNTTYRFDLIAQSRNGRPLLAAVLLIGAGFGESVDDEPRFVHTGIALTPDWIASEKELDDRMGQVAARRISGHRADIFVAVKGRHQDIIAQINESIFNLFALTDLREEAIEAQCHIARYFLRLDTTTSPPAVLTNGYGDAVDNGRSKLEDRIQLRAEHGKVGLRWLDWDTVSNKLVFDSFCTKLTEAFENAETALPPTWSPIARFSWAYELFVAGRLALHVNQLVTHRKLMHHGVPDGSVFVMFAELASACLSAGVRVDFWAERFPHLVRAAILFQSNPSTDVAKEQEWGIEEAPPEDVYSYYDGKTIPMRDVFALRARHAEYLATLTPNEQRSALEDALTFTASRVWDVGSGVATGTAQLSLDPLLFLEDQTGLP